MTHVITSSRLDGLTWPRHTYESFGSDAVACSSRRDRRQNPLLPTR